MKKSLLLFIALVLSACCMLLAQQEVRFGQHRVVPEQNVLRSRGAAKKALASIAPAGGRVNVLMQFSRVPDAAALRRLERAGVVLEGYVGGNAYFAQIAPGRKPSDFANLRATSVIGMRPEWKVSELLSPGRVPAWADRGNGRVAVTLSWFSNVDGVFVKAYIAKHGYALRSLSERLAQAEVEVPLEAVREIASEPWVRRLKPVDPPQEANNYNGRVLGAGSYLSIPAQLGGRSLTGRGVRVGLWDGNVENHVDFGDRLHVLEFEMGVIESGSHGMHTAGTIAGAGMLNPRARGIAPAAELYSMNFNRQSNGLIEQDEMYELYKKYNIALTSNSYGIGLSQLCDYLDIFTYGLQGKAYAIDRLAVDCPELTHVYAAGNEQGECGRKYASTTHRAKNVIYVGAVNANGNMSNFSSWGPMDDGRLIPTVSAKGVKTLSTVADNGYDYMDGTSMACPTVSGITTLLTERYHQLHGGQHMNSALVRGILANTADDMGNVGPDYQYGYGVVNGEAAVKVIEKEWYRSGTLVAGVAAQPYTIHVPAGVKQLRVMLTWTDAAVDKEYAYGEAALINDLDLSVSIAGRVVQPWVLDPIHPEAAATRGIDVLNNIEQITVDSPAAGDVVVTVAGQDKIRDGGKQGYTLTWYFDFGRPLLLHPVGGEQFTAGEQILLRADNLVGETKAEISYDDGKTYTYIGKVPSFYSVMLTVPKDAKTTIEGRIRLSDAEGHVLVNERPFTIVGQPQNLKFTASACSLSDWKLTWDAVKGASKYAVLKADVPSSTWSEIGEATAAEFSIPEKDIKIGGRNVYAVAVKMPDGSLGLRSQGVLAEQPTPMTLAAKDLPYFESFVTLPLVGASMQVGENLSMLPIETPVSVGYPVGSRMLQILVEKPAKGVELFKAPQNMFSIRICKLDLRGVPKGSKLVFNALALMKTRVKGGAKMRLMANGNQVKLTMGGDEAVGNNAVQQLYWDISEYAGNEAVQLELEYACHEEKQKGLFQESKSALMLIGYEIFEATDTPDVGLFYVQGGAIQPKPNMGVENVKVSVYSSSSKLTERVPLTVRLDGKLVGTHVVKDLKPFEQREVEIPVDFTSDRADGKIFNVEVRASVEGDVDGSNDASTFEVYNMGNVYPHPTYDEEKKVGRSIVYSDNGGLLSDYTGNGSKSIHFVPEDRTKAVQIIFKEWGFAEEDSLSLYSDVRKPYEYEQETPMGVLKGSRTGSPYVVLSHAKDGGIYVLFNESKGSQAKGWRAEVTAVPKANYFTLHPLEVANRFAAGEAAIKIKVKNNIPLEQRSVSGELIVAGREGSSAFQIPVLKGNEETEFEIPTKVKVPDPSLLSVKVAVYGNDVDVSDNVQTARIRNDKFWYGGTITSPAVQGIQKASVMPSGIDFAGVTFDRELTYHLDKELVFYTGTVNPLKITLPKKVVRDNLPATLHVWIDLNTSDNELKNEAPEYYSLPLVEGQQEYSFSVDLQGQKAGKRRMRIAVLQGEATSVKDFIEGKAVAWGRALDVTADIKEGMNPRAKDLGLKAFVPIASGVRLSSEQELTVTIVNNGLTAARNFELRLLVNGEEKAKETVTETVQPFGGELKYVLKNKVDLSGGVKEYNLELQLADDDVLENNTVKQRVVSLPEQATDRLYALDFHSVKKERIDYASLARLAELKQEATIEGWFYLRHSQFAWLFRSKGFSLASIYKVRFGIPDNGIAITVGKQQMAVSKSAVLFPGQFHHVAVSCRTVSGAWGASATKVEVFIDGNAVDMETNGESQLDLQGLFSGVSFDGMVKMMRVWGKALSVDEVKKNMHRAVREVNGKLPDDCVAEFMMNEGDFNYIGSGHDVASLATQRVGHKESNIWVDMSKRLITGVKFEGQLLASEVESDGELTFLMPYDYKVTSKLKGELYTLWGGTKVECNGVEVNKDTEFDFSGRENTITLHATVECFGQKLEQEVKVRLLKDKSPEAKLLKINLLAEDNPNLRRDVTVDGPEQSIFLTEVEDMSAEAKFDASKSQFTIADVSEGATVTYGDKTVTKGGKLMVDLTKPAMLEVRSANARTLNCYTLQIVKRQTVAWGQDELIYPFSTQLEAMNAKSSSGLPVVYRSDNEHVVTVDGEGRLHTSGVGETMLTAFAPSSGLYAQSEAVTRKVKVLPAELIVKPKAIEMEEGGAMPAIELEYQGLLFHEFVEAFKPIRYAVYSDATTQWDASKGGLPVGTYDVKPLGYKAPYADGNYLVILKDGKIEVKPSSTNRRVTFTVVDRKDGAILPNATIAIDGKQLTSDGAGKASIVLSPARPYSFTVTLADYAESVGVVELKDGDKEEKVELSRLELTVTYVAGANGAIVGKLTQRLAKGADAEQVVAVPYDGYRFLKWSDESKEAERQDKKVTTSATYTATFDVYRSVLKYAVEEGGEFITGESTQSQVVEVGKNGEKVSVRAKPGYFFAGWDDGYARMERVDIAKEDLSVTARFRKPVALPLCENFEYGEGLPIPWISTSEGSDDRQVVWKVGSNAKLKEGTRQCALAVSGGAEERKGGLQTPWLDISALGANDLEVSYTLYMDNTLIGKKKVTLQYRTEEKGAWQELKAFDKPVSAKQAQSSRVEYSSLVGKQVIQFRWFFEATGRAGIAVVDNVVIETKDRSVMIYVAGEGGKVKAAGREGKELRVESGKGVQGEEVTAVPDEGYDFYRWDDGMPKEARQDSKTGKYKALFKESKKAVFTFTYRAAEQGTIHGLAYQTNVEKGMSGSPVTAVALKEGYHFDRWSDESTDNPRVDKAMNVDLNVEAKFALNVYTLTYRAGQHGKIDAIDAQRIEHGKDGDAVRAIADEGYHFVKWSDGSTDNPRTDKAVKGDIEVEAEFAVNVYTLVYAAGVNGTIEGAAHQQVEHGKDGSAVTAIANSGYHFVRWSDGSTENPRTDMKVKSDKEVTAEFSEDVKVATLTFVVKGEDGAMLQGAEVEVDGKRKRTGASGIVAFEEFVLGEYSYTVRKDGYVAAEGKKVLEAQGTTVEVTLKKVSKPEPDAVGSELLSVVTLRTNPARAVLHVENAAAVDVLKVVTLRGEMLVEQRNSKSASEVVVLLDGVPEGMYVLVVEGDVAQRAIPFVVTK